MKSGGGTVAYRRGAWSVVLAAVLISGCFARTPETSLAKHLPSDPDLNVLVISFDALRADALGVYGNHRSISPNLDAFARKALVFDRAYTAANSTPTSFAAAFTGQLPFRVFRKWKLINTDTIASVFSTGGRRTFALLNNMQLPAKRNFHQGFDRYDAGLAPDEDILSAAKEWLEEYANDRFFGWIHFISPHSPYDAREMASQFYDSDYQGRFATTTGGKFSADNEVDLRRIRNLYDGEVFFGDHLFGELMSKIEMLGLLENTLVVVTSDHGEEFMEHGQLQHNSQFEEVIRIPLMIYHPGVRGGTRTDAPFLNVDFLPTLTSITAVDCPRLPDGIDLTETFRADRALVSVGMTHRTLRQFSVNMGTDKLIVTCKPENREELYDLASDPSESENRILDDPPLAAKLLAELKPTTYGDPCVAIAKAVAGRDPEAGLTADQIEQLKSLGYLQ